MRRVALVYNPASGQDLWRGRSVIDSALAALRKEGIRAEALVAEGPGSAARLTQEAVRGGCDSILACGGDGTVHAILQQLVGTQVGLGVLPMGTANALAVDLGFGSNPAKAIKLLLDAVPVRVPVGKVSYCDADGASKSRYFTVAAGVGADALFISRIDSRLKRKLGYLLYLLEGARVWATHSFPMFQASFLERDTEKQRVVEVFQLFAIRIRNFGGALHNLAPGASLQNERLTLLAFKTRSRLQFLRFLIAVLCRRHTFTKNIELLDVEAVECQAPDGSSSKVLIEADGELLGHLPVRIEIVPDALTLLMSATREP